MINETLLLIIGYLLASIVAYALHELAHYIVHGLYAESVTIGVTRYQPYVSVVYDRSTSNLAVRLGSIAPTLIYTPVVALGINAYLRRYPLPELSPTGWMMVIVPIAILVTPTLTDLRGCLNPSLSADDSERGEAQ